MINEKALQSNKNLQKPKISNLRDIIYLKFAFTHHTRRKEAEVLNYLVSISNEHKTIYPSYETISRECDLGVRQTMRTIKKLVDDGFITAINRTDKNLSKNKFGVISNLYVLNPLFYDITWRTAMSSVIPALKFLSLAVLLISSSTIAKQLDTHLQSGSRSKEVRGKEVFLDYNIYIKKHRAYRAHAREEFALCTTYSKKEISQIRERLLMNDVGVLYDNTVFSETVRKAGRELMMSCAGMCSVSSFNDMVINVALKRIETYSKTIQNPFGLFVSICNQVSKEMRMPVKHNKAYALASQFDITLGKDAAVLEGGNTPRESKKQKTLQWEVQKLSTTAKRHRAPANKVLHLSLEDLRLKNPSITMVGVKHISRGIVEIQCHNDTEWRETTRQEREVWLHTVQEARARLPQAYIQFIPKLEAPLYSKGDPNLPALKFYHIDSDNVLHDPGSLKFGCKLCDKKINIC